MRFRKAIVFTLIVAIVAGGLMASGCGESSQEELQMPTIELFQYAKGALADFDETTINSAANAEANVKYGTAKAIYQSVWAAHQENVSNQLFPPPYWKGDGVTTTYAGLASGDQTAVDATIFATKLSQAEQDIAVNAVEGMFSTYDEELAAAKPMEQNTAYGILYVSFSDNAATANAWKSDAVAWMAALDAWAAANKGGQTFAQLSYADRALATDNIFNKGAGTVNPEYAFWKAMAGSSFRNSIASSTNPTVRDGIATAQFGKAYAELDCIQRPTVDAYVYYSLDAAGQATVDSTVAFMVTDRATLDGVFTAGGMTTARAGFDAEADAGMNLELAFYKWLACESFRNGTVATFYPTQQAARVAELYPGQTYATLSRCEQMAVDAAVWAALNPYEQGFGGSVVSGLWGKVQAEMTDAIAMDQTSLIRGPTGLAAATGTETSVINWKKDVESGLTVKSAYYRWLAKESLLALKGLGTLIRLGTGEFLFKVTNPNKYAITIDSAQLNFQIAAKSTGDKVDAAKFVMADKVWVPAESHLLVRCTATVKQLDMVTWLVMAGKTSAAAMALSADVWTQYHDGTQTWIIAMDVTVSDDDGEQTQTQSYSF